MSKNYFSHTIPKRTELTEAARKSIEAFNKLSPLEQALYRADQRKSWVVGETMLAHPEMTREQAEKLYHHNDPNWREVLAAARAQGRLEGLEEATNVADDVQHSVIRGQPAT